MKFLPLITMCVLICILGSSTLAQPSAKTPDSSSIAATSTLGEWTPMFGSFLEPNRFGTVYDANPHYLRLEAGFGGRTLLIGETSIGAECLIWSGLKSLSDFRFPVETADYFFGLYSIFPIRVGDLVYPMRARISHISSHWVDGVKDSIVGGSSSRYSREFVSLETSLGEWSWGRSFVFRGTIGARWVFHQVTIVEAPVQFLASMEFVPLRFGAHDENQLFLSLSDCAGAYAPMPAAALVARFAGGKGNAALDVYGEYHSGYTRYGVKGDRKESGVEVGIRLGKNLLGN
ncbi:MAG: hypothetical protein JSS75_07040 [Bacteroidetes bacterium]|nr:hypothetical protein [Bacteroidota bacterium]